ncbi:hypothetical protein Bbelb_111200 [Branchiostoma belcheri]|nr:hypothetical protein Bbelb_111200 [Branchiostoma belcheri]
MEPWQVINSEGEGPYAVRTILGWSVNGPLRGASEDNRTASVNKISLSADQSLEVQLEQYFNQDFSEVDEDKKELSVQDKRFMDIVSKGTKRVNQHYEVPLPFTERPNPTMPKNRPLALHRTKYLKKNLSKDEKYRNDYVGFMQDIINKGYAERVPPEKVQNQEDTKDGAAWYIPHHSVYHPQKKKIRVVFDCAAEYAGTSLNKELLQGPDLNNTLVGVLTRFRQEPVGLMADIESMFSQVRVPEENRDYQGFLWWPEGNLHKPLQEYRMAVHVFGATSSPSCAGFALKKLAEDGEGRYTEEVLESIRNNFYVDDLLKSTSTVKEGGHLAKDTREACKDGGFRLTKWVSNYKEVMGGVLSTKRIAEENLDLDCSHEATATERALGMLWNIQSDTLGFRAVRREKPATRRGIPSVVSSFYDPLGLVAPALLPPKKILQDLCRDKVGWDEDISEKHLRAWRHWEEELPLHFQVSRCLKPDGFGKPATTQLHHFADASEVGYGTVSYVRMTNEQGDVHCAWIIKVRQALKQKCKGGTTTTERGLTTSNLEQAEMVIMKHVQNRYYKQEVEALKGQEFVRAGSTILQLSPKLDVDGMLRVGGRLSQATLSEEAKNPMLLPKSSRVAELVVREIHENHGHMGRNYLTAKVRERYWIPQSSTLIRKIINRCVICRRHHGKTGEQKMADLPSHRVTPDEPPFTNVGVDYFRGRSIVKRK